METTLSLAQVIMLALGPLFMAAVAWLCMPRNWPKIREIYLLRRFKSRCIVVTLHRANGGRVTRIAVPDPDGSFELDGGRHVFKAERATWDAKHRLPHIDAYHGEIAPRQNIIHTAEGYHYVVAKSADVSGFTALELEAFIRSRVLSDVATAISREMRQLTLMYYMIFGILAAVILSMGLNYYLVQQVQTDIVAALARFLNIQAAPVEA